jgi:hypothetical protein
VNVIAVRAVVTVPEAAMPLVTADRVNVQTPSGMIVIIPPSTMPGGGVIMLVAVVPVTWNSGPEATIVAADATGALNPIEPVGK